MAELPDVLVQEELNLKQNKNTIDGDDLTNKNNATTKQSLEAQQSQQSQSNDNNNASDDNGPPEIVQETEAEEEESKNSQLLSPEAKEHYDHLSDSLSHHSYIDEDEEKKIEEEISNNLSHLTIDREISDGRTNKFNALSPFQKNQIIHWNQNVQHHMNDDIDYIDDDDEAANHEQINYPSISPKIDQRRQKFSLNKEFFYNESFLKYLLLYGTIYFISKQSLNRYYNLNGADIDIHSISRKIIMISNAIITTFKANYIWKQSSHQTLLTPFNDLMNENETKYVDIQKAFYVIMIILSYFGGRSLSRTNYLNRLYNIICLGCIILIKKYKKCGALFMYTSFWTQLSSLFINTSKILQTMSGFTRYPRMLRNLGKSSSIIFSLIMVYSRLYLFTKTMVPIIQHCYRYKRQYAGSIASILFLISGYYKTGDGLVTTFLALKK